MAVHLLVFTFTVIFQCLPIHSIWDPSIKGKCLNLNAVIYAGAAISILEDLAIIILPAKQVVALDLPGRKKWALGFMFSLGSL